MSQDANIIRNRNLLQFTNLSYLLPVAVIWYKELKQHTDRLVVEDAIALTLIFAFLGLVASWNYHGCRSYIANIQNVDALQVQALPCQTFERQNCQESTISFEMTHFIDYFIAYFSFFLAVHAVYPVKSRQFLLTFVFAMLWFLYFLMYNNRVVAGLPCIIIVLRLIWFCLKSKSTSHAKLQMQVCFWSAASLCFLVGAILLEVFSEPYWLHHSVWHILSGISAALFLSSTFNVASSV